MKNADMPAMPQTEEEYNDAGEYVLATRGGLTKREHFAGLAMQATRTAFPNIASDERAALAINDADALLSALDGTES